MRIAQCISPNEGEKSLFLCRLSPPEFRYRTRFLPVIKMDQCIDVLGKVKIFLALGANLENSQTAMEEKTIEKTVFITHHALLKYTHLPCGLKSAPSTFQRPWMLALRR